MNILWEKYFLQSMRTDMAALLTEYKKVTRKVIEQPGGRGRRDDKVIKINL